MAKKNNKDQVKNPIFKTKHKADNSIEVTVTKAPSKTLSGKIIIWAIAALTMLLPVAGLIYLIATI